jgi:hypothetical protein
MGGYAVQALWSLVDGKAVIPSTTSGTTVAVAGWSVPAKVSPLRSMVTTVTSADAQATPISFMALFTGHDRVSPIGSQDSPALLAAQSPGSGAALAPSLPVAGPPIATITVGVIPYGSPGATSLRPAQDARNDSGGDDYLPHILEDALPAAGSALSREEAFPSAAVSRIEQEVLPAFQPDAALWREASTAYFAQQGAADGPVEGDLLAPWLLAVAVAAKQDENRPCAESNGRRLRTRHAGVRPSTDEARHAR